MKKIFFLSIFLSVLLLSGCSNYNEKDIIKNLNKKMKNITGYQVEGTMEIYNGENTYRYNVTSSYEKDKYRVSLINKANNHEQIILRNDDGVYVLTPSLNKSFKFQSDWPNNNSQVYLIKSIIKDVNKDKNITLQSKDNKYILKNKISYSNNKKYNNQKIYLDKNLNFKKVEVFDNNGNIQIMMNFKNVDLNATFNNKYFSTEENMKTSINTYNDELPKKSDSLKENNNNNNESEENISEENEEESTQNNKIENEEQTSLLDETIYPMYLPEGTYLSNEETVSKEDGDRIILTFAGQSPFILVEENVYKSNETEIIPVYGEPTMLIDSIGALSDSSVNFISNGVEYYIAAENLTKDEIISVVESINSIAVSK